MDNVSSQVSNVNIAIVATLMTLLITWVI